MAASNAMNDKIEAAVAVAQQWAKRAPGVSPDDIQYVLPDQKAWAQHQAWDADSWIFKNDTWVHPSKAGHKQLANTVTAGMCRSFGQWCGDKPAWVKTPQIAQPSIDQDIQGKVPARISQLSAKNLPDNTKQGNPLGWRSKTRGICTVHEGDVVAKEKSGTCRLAGFSARNGEFEALRERAALRVRNS